MHYITPEILQLLIFILAGLQFLDLFIAVTLYFIYNRDHHYLNSIFIWIGLILFYMSDIAQGGLSLNHPFTSFAFAIITGVNIARLIAKLYFFKFSLKKTWLLVISCYTFSGVLYFSGVQEFWMIAAPISLAISLPIFYSAIRAYGKIHKGDLKGSSVDYIFISIALIWGLHFMDYPFFRPIEDLSFSFFGFSFAIILVYFLSILIPVVINRRIFLNINDLIQDQLEMRTQELEKAYTVLDKQERLASMGSLIAGVAHEIKNPLNIINLSNNYLSNFVKKYNINKLENIFKSQSSVEKEELQKQMDKFQETSTIISKNITRADNIIKTMLSHARGDESRVLATTDINRLIIETCNLLEKSKVDFPVSQIFSFNLNNQIPTINTYINDLRRVLINLCENSIYSLSEKLKIDPQFKPELIITTSVVENSKNIQITIKDNGIGIPPDKIARIFDPFMTSKPAGEGTGLGLSIARDIVNEHMGNINVESELGVGATFKITISTLL